MRSQSFYIDESPYVFYDEDIKKVNLDFISSIDTSIIDCAISTFLVAQKEGTSDRIQTAALNLRLIYSIALETMLALLCSVIQSPDCTIGWMLKYNNKKLKSVVEKISYPEKLIKGRALVNITNKDILLWSDVARIIYLPLKLKEPETFMHVSQIFGTIIKKLAEEFLDPTFKWEFNSIKHGIRCQSGGHTLSIFQTGQYKNLASWVMQNSRFGLTFYSAEKVEDCKSNIHVHRYSNGWDPECLTKRLVLIKCFIESIRVFLRLFHGVPGQNYDFLVEKNSHIYLQVLNEAWGYNYEFLVDENLCYELWQFKMPTVYFGETKQFIPNKITNAEIEKDYQNYKLSFKKWFEQLGEFSE